MQKELAITVVAAGTTVTTGAASASVALPNTSAGTRPYYIRVTASAESFVRLGTSAGVTATGNDLLIQPADSVILSTAGCTHIAYIQGVAAARVNIIPLEDQ